MFSCRICNLTMARLAVPASRTPALLPVCSLQGQPTRRCTVLETSQLHFVRCFKPNDAKAPDTWDASTVSHPTKGPQLYARRRRRGHRRHTHPPPNDHPIHARCTHAGALCQVSRQLHTSGVLDALRVARTWLRFAPRPCTQASHTHLPMFMFFAVDKMHTTTQVRDTPIECLS